MALNRLPGLHEAEVQDQRAHDDAPFPADALVLEDALVDDGQVDDGEGDDEAGHDGPQQEAVVDEGLDDGEGAAEAARVQVEEAAPEVLDLPRRDEQDEAQEGEDGRAAAEDDVAGGVPALVAVAAQLAVAWAEGDDDEGDQTQDAGPAAVQHLVDDELRGEDADAQVARPAHHDVGLGLFQPETQGEEGRRDHVDPEDLQGGEGEDGVSAAVLERERDEEQDDLRDVGDEQMHEELEWDSVSDGMPERT